MVDVLQDLGMGEALQQRFLDEKINNLVVG